MTIGRIKANAGGLGSARDNAVTEQPASANGEAKPADHQIAPYVVALVDVLNQRQRLQEWDPFPDSDDAKEKLGKALAGTLGAVEEVRKVFRIFADCYVPKFIRPMFQTKMKEYTATEWSLLRKRFLVSIHCQCFSDTTLLYSPVCTSTTLTTVLGVEALLSASAMAMIFALGHGIAIRGAIEFGTGSDFFPNEIYGPVLHRVYQLEQEVAKHPRIVVGKGVIDFLERWKSRSCVDLGEEVNRQRAQVCEAAIIKDGDNVPMVHYLGDRIREVACIDDGWRVYVEQAYQFVLGEYQRFSLDDRDEKLAKRYAEVVHYFDTWISRWC